MVKESRTTEEDWHFAYIESGDEYQEKYKAFPFDKAHCSLIRRVDIISRARRSDPVFQNGTYVCFSNVNVWIDVEVRGISGLLANIRNR